jgi:hypothetical protein
VPGDREHGQHGFASSTKGWQRPGSWILRQVRNTLGHDGSAPAIDLPQGHRRSSQRELEVRSMHDDSLLVAIDAALRSPASCACGKNLTVAIREDAAWLECVAFAAPSRLPTPVATFVRETLHDRSFLIEAPQPVAVATARVPRASAVRAVPSRA